jgi:hypothetical protein
MRCALVQNSDNIVVNLIMADPSTDTAHDGTTIVGLPDDSPVSFDWIYDPTTGQFTDPNPPVEEIIEVTP